MSVNFDIPHKDSTLEMWSAFLSYMTQLRQTVSTPQDIAKVNKAMATARHEIERLEAATPPAVS